MQRENENTDMKAKIERRKEMKSRYEKVDMRKIYRIE